MLPYALGGSVPRDRIVGDELTDFLDELEEGLSYRH